MDFKSHLAFGALISLLLINFVGYNKFIFDNIMIHILILLFSVLPDIDIHDSKIGKSVGFFSKIIQLIFGHRGFFHSLWMVLLLYIILLPFGYEIAVYGYIGHLLVDMITSDGIKVFYPILHIKGIVPTNFMVNYIFFILILGIDCLLILNLFYNFW